MSEQAARNAIDDAKTEVDALLKHHLPSWDHRDARIDFLNRLEHLYEHLGIAMLELTQPRRQQNESEDGTTWPASPN